jgi:DNA invertase Pin-like site-specific DNA recombinase
LIYYYPGNGLHSYPFINAWPHRPSLFFQLLPENLKQNKMVRDKIVVEAIEHHGYTKRAVADHLGIHYSTVNRILTKMSDKTQKYRPAPQA